MALSTGAAFAADLPTHKGPPPAPVVAPYNWTGFYGSLEGGFGWGGESDNFNSVTGFPLDHFGVSGAKGGAQIGYNQQFNNNFVLGVVGDFEFSDIHGSKGTSFLSGEGTGVSSLSLHNNWQSSIRGNIGMAFDRLLIYATGGIAFANDTEKYYVNAPGYTASPWAGSPSQTLVGWTLGIGADYAFDAHWFGGVELRYADFGKGTFGIPASLSESGTQTSFKAGFDETLAQIILGYKF